MALRVIESLSRPLRPYIRGTALAIPAAVALLGLALPPGPRQTLINSLSYANLAVPWAVVFALGYPSLASAAFYGLGAYVFAYLLTYGVDPLLSGILSAASGFAVAALLGHITLRLRGIFFFFSTLAISEALRQLFTYAELSLTGHLGKIVWLRLGDVQVLGLQALLLTTSMAFHAYVSGPKHRILVHTARSDRILAASLGVNVHSYAVKIFATASSIQAACGAASAPYLVYIDPQVFDPMRSLVALVIGMLGGFSSAPLVVGSAIMVNFAYEYAAKIAAGLHLIAIGSLLTLLAIFARGGLPELLKKI